MTTRALFCCNSFEQFGTDQPRRYKFSAVSGDSSVPEAERYHRFTPSGTFELCVDNPNVSFEPGKFYYLDISEAPTP
jgi:hypothetical protein